MRGSERGVARGAPQGTFRRMHPFALISEALDVARGFALPAVVGGASMGGGHMGRMMLWGAVILGVPTLIMAVAEYLALRYRATSEELIVDSGVLSRRHRVIPLSRVQNLELRQSALQRAFGVAELRVETAGGEGEEPVPLLLERTQAERLRTELLARRGRTALPDGSVQPAGADPVDVLARLSARDLALAGATANEAGVIAAILIGAVELADQLPLGLPRLRLERELVPDLPVLSMVLLGLALALAFVGVAWLLSIAGAVAGYWGYTLEKAGGELRTAYGAFNRTEATIPLARVQAIRIEESLLRRPFGLAALKVETAGVGPAQSQGGGAEAFLPLARRRELPRLVDAVVDGLHYGELTFHRVHPYARTRTFLRYTAAVVAATAAGSWIAGPPGLWLLALLGPAYAMAAAHYRHTGYARPQGFLVARGGVFNRVTWIVPEGKLQTAHAVETLLQRRRGLATLLVDTAAGTIGVPDLGREDAHAILNGFAASPGR